eukprot:scaffold76955_cov65-Attheya_sp.AAC.3
MACVAWHTRIPHAYAPHMTGDVQNRLGIVMLHPHFPGSVSITMISFPSVIWYLIRHLTQYASWHMALSVEVTENNRQMHRDRMQESPFFRDDGDGGKAGSVGRWEKTDVSVIKEPIT